MERYFYFGENDVDTTGEACMFPLSSFLGATPGGDDNITLHFKARNGNGADDVVTIDFATAQGADATITTKSVMAELALLMKGNNRNVFVNINDGESNTGVLRSYFTPDSTDVTTVA